jgi:hypothetical protein
MFTQTDSRWADYEIVKGNASTTIKERGCLLTSICNILVVDGYDFTPLTLCQKLQDSNGFDNIGNLLWSVLNNLFGLKENKYLPADKITWSNLTNINYIVQCFYLDTGHFCNIQSVANNIITYHDTYDGLTKQINISRVMSIREVIKI